MTAKWIWAGAKSPGTSHIAGEVPCQDTFQCRIWNRGAGGPVLIAALADGAGSAKHALLGAEYATSCVTTFIAEAFDEGMDLQGIECAVEHAIRRTRAELELTAERDEASIDDFASTLLIAIVAPTFATIAQIGDGAIVIGDEAGEWLPVHWPDHGEYANTTSFLTQTDALAVLEIATFGKSIKRLAMFSDGLERLVLDFSLREAHKPFFDSIFSRMLPAGTVAHLSHLSMELEQLLASEAVNSRTDDDKSLVCAQYVEA